MAQLTFCAVATLDLQLRPAHMQMSRLTQTKSPANLAGGFQVQRCIHEGRDMAWLSPSATSRRVLEIVSQHARRSGSGEHLQRAVASMRRPSGCNTVAMLHCCDAAVVVLLARTWAARLAPDLA